MKFLSTEPFSSTGFFKHYIENVYLKISLSKKVVQQDLFYVWSHLLKKSVMENFIFCVQCVFIKPN